MRPLYSSAGPLDSVGRGDLEPQLTIAVGHSLGSCSLLLLSARRRCFGILGPVKHVPVIRVSCVNHGIKVGKFASGERQDGSMNTGRLRTAVSPERGQCSRAIRLGESNHDCAPHVRRNSDRLWVLVSCDLCRDPGIHLKTQWLFLFLGHVCRNCYLILLGSHRSKPHLTAASLAHSSKIRAAALPNPAPSTCASR